MKTFDGLVALKKERSESWNTEWWRKKDLMEDKEVKKVYLGKDYREKEVISELDKI